MEGRPADPACNVRSPFDQVLTGIRGNEPRAVSMVHGTDGYKAIAFVLSGALTGIVSGTTALVFGVVPVADRARYPEQSYWHCFWPVPAPCLDQRWTC